MIKSTISIKEITYVPKVMPIIFKGDIFSKLIQINHLTNKNFTTNDLFVIDIDTGIDPITKERYGEPKLCFKSPIYDTLKNQFQVVDDRAIVKKMLDWFTIEYRKVVDIVFSKFQGMMLDHFNIERMRAYVNELIQYSLSKGPQYESK